MQETWPDLLALANEEGVGGIDILNPHKTLHSRPPRLPHSFGVPEIPRGATIRVEFHLPMSETNDRVWPDWFAVVLSEDPSGYLCLTPRFAKELQLSRRLPKTPSLIIDRLDLDKTMTGLHSLILIAAENPLPEALDTMLCEDREGPALQPALNLLAVHLIGPCRAAKAGIRRLPFLVV